MVDGSGNRGLRNPKCFGQDLFSEVMTEVNKGDFEGLVQGEGSWSGCWFVPEEVCVQGSDECGELVAVQPGCTMVLQRSFRFGLSILLAFYPHFLPLVGPLSSWWVLPLMNKPQ